MAKIRVEIMDGIAVIELNDPPANTYSYEMMQEIDAAVLEGLSIEREIQQLLFQSDDAKEGIAANLEKRKPQFRGR